MNIGGKQAKKHTTNEDVKSKAKAIQADVTHSDK